MILDASILYRILSKYQLKAYLFRFCVMYESQFPKIDTYNNFFIV